MGIFNRSSSSSGSDPSGNGPSKEAVLNALRTVEDPDLKRDLVTLGMVSDIEIGASGEVSLRVILTTPACPLKAKIEADVKAAVSRVEGVKSVAVTMDSRAPGRRAGDSSKATDAMKGISHVIAVSSGKGGVGKSSVAVNLAVSLALDGARVGLMDVDVHGPNTPTMLGVTDVPHLEKDEGGRDLMVPPVAHGVKLMSMGFLVDKDQPVIWRGPMLHNLLTQFTRDVKWGELDYLILDMPPGTGDVQISISQLISMRGAVLVTTPQEVAAQDVRRAVNMWAKVKVPVLGVVENMSYFVCDGCEKRHEIFGSGAGARLAEKFGTTLIGQVPLVTGVREGGDAGRPIVVSQPDSPAARAFREIAGVIARRAEIAAAEEVDPSQIVQIGRFT